MTLNELKIGESAKVTSIGGEKSLRQHFLDMGVIPGEEVTLIKYAPMGDPMELRVRGYELTLRLEDAKQIDIEPVERQADNIERSKSSRHEEKAKIATTASSRYIEDNY